jgi:hypothetical protein
MMKRLVGFGLGLALLGAGSVAWAGQQGVSPLTINLTDRYLWGAIGDTRNTSDTQSYLDVVVQANASGVTGVIFARDATGQFAYCYTYSASIISALQSVTNDAAISVQWDADNMCTYAEVRASSVHEPKAP